jgi:hypothetical protein
LFRRTKSTVPQIRKKDVKLSLFTVDVILYLKDPKDSTKNLLDLTSTFGKVEGYKINPAAFLYTNSKQAEKEIRKIIPFIIT